MGIIRKTFSSTLYLVSAVVLALSLSVYLCPVPIFPHEEVVRLATEYYGSDTSCPMCDKIAIVTGSTNGLGESIALQMYKMGATVVVASRSDMKCYQTVERFKAVSPGSKGVAVAKALDLSDLQSVKDFAAWFRSNFDRLDVLVNNGAINYITTGAVSTKDAPLRSRHGFDLAFATNYLGHFVLTERLLPLLKSTRHARIMQVSSNSQYMVDGWDLMPMEGGWPMAARVMTDNATHRGAAYGNSKLAQILHAKELQWILDKDPTTDLKILSCSPGLTNTGMIPAGNKALKAIIDKMFYSSDAAMYSTFVGLFSPDIKGGEYVHNSPSVMLDTTFGRWQFGIGPNERLKAVPAPLKGLVFVLQTFYQAIFYKTITFSAPNRISENGELLEEFYHWSKMHAN